MENRQTARPSAAFAAASILLTLASIFWGISAVVYAYQWFQTVVMDVMLPSSALVNALWACLCAVAAILGLVGARFWWRGKVIAAGSCTLASVLLLFLLPRLFGL